jgi:hypothetical protein
VASKEGVRQRFLHFEAIAQQNGAISDEELDRTIYEEIYAEAERCADFRHCFIEADMSSLDDPERSW